MAFDINTAKPKFDLQTAKALKERTPKKKAEKKDVDFKTMEMIKNFPSSLVKLGKDTVAPFFHPIDTAKGIGNLAMGGVEKLDKNLASVLPKGYVEYGNIANNWLVDKLGAPESWRLPEKAEDVTYPNEKYADAMGQFFKSRYGSSDKAKTTLMDDPAGVLSDVSMALTGLGGVVKVAPGLNKAGNVTQKIGMSAEPINLVKSTGKYAAAKLTPKDLPANLYDRAAKWGTGVDSKERANITKTALDNQIMPDAEGLALLKADINIIGREIDSLIDAADKTGVKIPKKVVLKHLKALREDMGGVKLDGRKNRGIINNVEKEFNMHMHELGRETISVKELQEFKQDIYKSINYNKKNQIGNRAKDEAGKAMARAAKEQIEEITPEIQSLNAKQGELLELLPHLEKSAKRIGNRNLMPFGTPVNVAAGGVVADVPGMLAGGAASASQLPGVQAGSALRLHDWKRKGMINYLDNQLPSTLIHYGLLNAERNNQAR